MNKSVDIFVMEPRLRANPEQFLAMIDFMERHGDIARPLPGSQSRLQTDKMWLKLTNILNSVQGGVKRKSERWKKVWTDWKTKTKKKFLCMKQRASTGGNHFRKLALTPLEVRVVEILGCSKVVRQADPVKQVNSTSSEPINDDGNSIDLLEEANLLEIVTEDYYNNIAVASSPTVSCVPSPPDPLQITPSETDATTFTTTSAKPTAPVTIKLTKPMVPITIMSTNLNVNVATSSAKPTVPIATMSPKFSTPVAITPATPIVTVPTASAKRNVTDASVTPESPPAFQEPPSPSSTRSPSTHDRQRSVSPLSMASSTRRRVLLKARRNRGQTPFDRAADQFAAIERRRLQHEEASAKRLHEREMERLRLEAQRIEVDREHNSLLRQLYFLGHKLIDFMNVQRPGNLPSTDPV